MPARSRAADDSTDEGARLLIDRIEADVTRLDAAVVALLVEVREHRTASTAQHTETQRAVAALATRLDALGGGQGGPGGSGQPGAPPGGVLAAVPPAAWGGVGTLVGTALAAALLGVATALGWTIPTASPATPAAPVEVAPITASGAAATP